MRIQEKSRVVLATGVFVLMGFAGSKAAYASPPANDNFADASSISTLPFTDSGDLGGTTTEPGEPQFCSFLTQSVWYVFTPSSTVVIRVDVNTSGPGILNVYRSFGGGFGGLGFMGCTGGGSTSVTADAGTTYYIQVGSGFGGGGQMTLNVAQIPPPAHDDFANAIEVGSLPFVDSSDITAATTQAGEPLNPGGSQIGRAHV